MLVSVLHIDMTHLVTLQNPGGTAVIASHKLIKTCSNQQDTSTARKNMGGVATASHKNNKTPPTPLNAHLITIVIIGQKLSVVAQRRTPHESIEGLRGGVVLAVFTCAEGVQAIVNLPVSTKVRRILVT